MSEHAGTTCGTGAKDCGRCRLWPGMVFLLLGANVAVVATTVALSRRGDGAGVVKQYDVKAQGWDEERLRRLRQEEIGWTCDMVARREGGRTLLHLTMLDREGLALENQSVRVRAFQSGVPSDVRIAERAANGEAWIVPTERDGWWTFIVEVERGKDLAIYKGEIDLLAPDVTRSLRVPAGGRD